jgi:predicted Rossmann fold flavoprotein
MGAINKTPVLAVIGGGAAGFFCALNAAKRNPTWKIIILEKSGKLLSKVKISGGGRCNVTHACFSISEMAKKYPRGALFVKKAFHQFFTQDTIDWFAARGVPLKEEPDGRMFPTTDSSQTIIDCLLREADKLNVHIRMHAEVCSITKVGDSFELQLSSNEPVHADYVCIASGGYPKSAMFDWLRRLGHTIADPVPSLFTFNIPRHPITALMGLSVTHAQVKIRGTKLKEQGPILITHWGLSGPAILRLSAWGARELAEKSWNFSIQVNWIPAFHEESLRTEMLRLRAQAGAQKVSARNSFGLPARLWEFLMNEAGVLPEMRWGEIPAKAQHKFISNLCAYEMEVKGKTTYKEEFVTAGGIMLDEVNSHTMMSKKIPGLYFAGELLNVDGITGGFNFQNAWTTGYIAARHMGQQPASD